MIEIQCTSCHTRYRIDERVLPADSPTFKCSRCGHVFTTDPLAAKKVSADQSSKPQAPRISPPRANPRADVTLAAPTPKVSADATTTTASERPVVPENPVPASEAKPAPIRPYIRNQRPTVFDRTPEPLPPKPAAEPDAEVDSAAVARMKAAIDATTPGVTASEPSRPASESAKPASPPSRQAPVTERGEAADEGENFEFDFRDEREPDFGSEPAEDDIASTPQRWSVGDDAAEPPSKPPGRPAGFGSGELDPEYSRGEPAPIGRGTIPQYVGSRSIQHSEPLPDPQAYIESTELHSARSFIGLFFAVALMFVVVTFVIYGIPSASAELLRRMPVIGPEFAQTVAVENQVAVSDVQLNYQIVKGGHPSLVVTGVVKNNAVIPLHTVRIGVQLLDPAQHEVASSAVYCGTTLSPRMIGEMTPHELEFLQKLDPQKTFVLEPGRSAPFLMVFIDPPRNLNHLAVTVARARPPAATQSGQQANAHQ